MEKDYMIYVYRAINRTKQEVYHGVSRDLIARRDGSHCVGGTKALRHWNCGRDEIQWKVISQHYRQQIASSTAHALEKNYRHHQGYINITTAGI